MNAQGTLDAEQFGVHVFPLTTTTHPFNSEIVIESDVNGLDGVAAAQYQHLRAISPRRILAVRGNVGAITLGQLRETIAVILDLP